MFFKESLMSVWQTAIIIAGDIMVAGFKPDHSGHDQTFTSLLQTAQKCNVKLQYKQNEVYFFGET